MGGVGGDGSGANGGRDRVTINVRCYSGSKFSVQVGLDSTVASFKSLVAEKGDVPPEQQRLIYKGRILKDDQTLTSYGMEADHTVHLVRGFGPNASADPPGATNSGSSNTATPPVDSGPLGGTGLGGSLFPALDVNGFGGSGNFFGARLPVEQMQQQLTQNPNMMRDLLDSPLIQNLMNNPDLLRNMIMNSPEMREIMDRNPELSHMINDPAILRQSMEAARNPELMREMMRNTDRAMSNIESSPEGFNMLRRMYENVQEPLLNATTMGGDGRSDSSSNPFAALLGAQAGGSLGRDQLNNSTAAGSETTGDSPAPNTNPLPNPWASAGAGGIQNTTAPFNMSGNARSGGLGGLGFPGIEGLMGSTPDANSLNQLLQNPAITEMIQSILSNPQHMDQMLGLNPQMRNLLDANPQLREMMQNRDFIRQLLSAETVQQIMTLQQSLLSQLGRQQPSGEPGQTGRGTALDFDLLANMFGELGTGGLTAPNRSNAAPEELYVTQLEQLQEMGFSDTRENIQALAATAGNVHAAVEWLLGNPGQ